MPQMAPLLWLNLMFVFLATFTIFISLNYFVKPPSKMDSEKPFLPQKQKSWLW